MEVCCGRVHYTCQCFYSISTLQKLSLNVIYNRHDWYGCKLHFSPVINSTWIYLMLLPMWSWQTQTSNIEMKNWEFSGYALKAPRNQFCSLFLTTIQRETGIPTDILSVSPSSAVSQVACCWKAWHCIHSYAWPPLSLLLFSAFLNFSPRVSLK